MTFLFLYGLLALHNAFAANAPHYQATIHPQAVSCDGRTFDHHFSVSTELFLEPTALVQASARVTEVCDYGDDSIPRDCENVCEVSLRSTIGYVRATNFNLDNGQAEVLSRPILAFSTARGAAQGCTVDSVKLESVSVENLLFSFEQVDLQLFHSWDAPLAKISLAAKGGGIYELSSAVPASSLVAFWDFRESTSWSVSGPLKMERVK